jgi:hypothetical protein
MDFGNSLRLHGDLVSKVQLDDEKKVCPECESEILRGERECPICGFEFLPPKKKAFSDDTDDGDKETITHVEMVEIDIMNSSPFRWVDLFGSGKVMMASGFEAWCATVSPDNDRWTALGKLKTENKIQTLMLGQKAQCLAAADDFLRMNETDSAAKKNKKWLNDVASEKQLKLLAQIGYGKEHMFSFTKYSAACQLNFFWNKRLIERAIFV